MIHFYDTDIAKEFGVAEAVLISNFSFWIFKNKTNGSHFYDGHYWTYNSVRALCEQFPEYSKRQIERALDNLISAGVLIKGEYNSNRYDRTNWYAFSDENRFLPAGNSISPNGEINFTKRGNQFHQTGEPIPDINTNINTDNIIPPKDKSLDPHGVKPPTPTLTGKISSPSSAKESFGEFGTVKLTRQEYEKVCALYQRRANEAITILDDYLASHGKKKYTSHYAVLKRNGWVWEKLAADGIPFGPRILDPKDFKKAEPL